MCYQHGGRHSTSQIRDGMRAELVILAADPFTTAPQDLRTAAVLAMLEADEVVFRRESPDDASTP